MEGFEKLEAISPDALLLDNNLPDGRGWIEADTIHNRFPYMNITLISAFQIPKEFKSQISNCIHFLEKPITLHDIEKYI
jgi:response regulator of citrate/malate metabolism